MDFVVREFETALHAKQLSTDMYDELKGKAADTGVETAGSPPADDVINAPQQLTEEKPKYPLDMTLSYQENQYYGVPFEKTDQTLLPITRFWNDYANYLLAEGGPKGAFLSQWVIQQTRNLTEVSCQFFLFFVNVLC